MADPLIEAKADRYVRRAFRNMSKGVEVPGDEVFLAVARRRVVAILSMERGRREARRRRHEMTIDMFNRRE